MIKSSLQRIPGARSLATMLRRQINKVKTNSRTREYILSSPEKKLHIGCGFNRLDGWLNSDFFPVLSGVIHIDATKQFPIPSSSFDYIFSEHMIEHIDYRSGQNMLSECLRVLKPGGKIRVSTPDLKFLIELYTTEKSKLQKDYLDWAATTYAGIGAGSDTVVINNFVRNWGHRFIYDTKTLRASLERAGFVDVESCKLNESSVESLRALENERRMPAGFLQLESLTLEATKPLPTNNL